jgi:imidazoleglycerol-phosphate dehydratase
MREAVIGRETKETRVEVRLNLDGSGRADIETGIGFLDHMLELFCRHGLMDLCIKAAGDTNVDYHHTVEDIGIVLGQAFITALGDKKGIKRYATVFTPMDESLSMVALDISGRPFLRFDVTFTGERVGSFDLELVEEFLRAFAVNGGLTLHVGLIHGSNNHHIAESIFKGLGRALDQAALEEPRIEGVLSTKGTL